MVNPSYRLSFSHAQTSHWGYNGSTCREGNVDVGASRIARFAIAAKVALVVLLACALVPLSPFDAGVSAGKAFAETAPKASSSSSTDSGQRVVRVGYMDIPGMISRNADGSLEGYTYDYLQRIAQFTGWTYEFVKAEGETSNEQAIDLMNMLEDGRIDLESGMTYSPALDDTYEYPRNSYGTAHTSLFVPNENAGITATNLFTEGPLHIAILSSAKQRREELDYFCEKNNLAYTTVECASNSELAQKVRSGEADAFLSIDISPVEGFHVVTSFAGRPFFFAAPKGDRTIIDEIDRTIERINESNPQLQSNLYEKYFGKTSASFALNAEELAFARNHDTLRVGVISEKAPLQSFDKKTGELKGVSRGMLDYVEKQTGLTFEIVPIDRSDNLLDAVRTADVEIVAGVESNDAAASTLDLSLTAPYMTTSLLLVYNRHVDPDNLESRTLALPWDMTNTAPAGSDFIICDSIEDCFKAVNEGRADYTYGTSYTTPYYSNIDGLSNLLTLPTSTQTIGISFGIVQPVEPELLSVIDKTIRGLSTEELDSIVYENALIDPDEHVGAFISSHLLEFAIGAIAVLMLIIMLLVLYLRTRVLSNRRVREENLRFQKLYSLTNEQLFEYSMGTDTLIMSNPSGLKNLVELEAGELSEDRSHYIIHHAHALIAEKSDPELLDALTSPSKPFSELQYEPDPGDAHWIRIVSHLVTNDEGRPISVIGKITRVDEEVREKMDLSKRAQHDGLTGLLSWATFRERAEQQLETGTCGALLVIDTDDFKSVNDTYGHLAGDAALRQTATVLRNAFRSHDLIGRLGGDEFAVCICGSIEHSQLVERCSLLVEQGVEFSDQDGIKRLITLSIGGIEISGTPLSYRDAYQQADSILYRAKADGKDRFVLEKAKEGQSPIS